MVGYRAPIEPEGQSFGIGVVGSLVDMCARLEFKFLIHYLAFEIRFMFWAKMAFLASAPPAFLPAAIFFPVALPKEPSVPFFFILSVALPIQFSAMLLSLSINWTKLGASLRRTGENPSMRGKTTALGN